VQLPELPAGRVEGLLALQRQLEPYLTDPRVIATLRLLIDPDLPANAVGPATWVKLLKDVPEERVVPVLRVLGDADFPDPTIGTSKGRIQELLALPADELDFVVRHGAQAWLQLTSDATRRDLGIFSALVDKLEGMPPAEQNALVSRMFEVPEGLKRTPGPRRQLLILGLEPPERVTPPPPQVIALPKDALWSDMATAANAWAKGHAAWFQELTAARYAEALKTDPSVTTQQIEDGIKHDLQIAFLTYRRAGRGDFSGLPLDRQLALLAEYDAWLLTTLRWTGKASGGWRNQYRGKFAEMISPDGGHIRLFAEPGKGTPTEPDFINADPVTPAGKTGGKIEYGERKSDLITAPPGSTTVYGPARTAAYRYRKDADLDWPAIKANNGVHVMDFKNPPGNEPTRQAMLEILFSDDPRVYAPRTPDYENAGPPFAAVQFGDGKGWITREEWLAERAAAGP